MSSGVECFCVGETKMVLLQYTVDSPELDIICTFSQGYALHVPRGA